MTVSHTALVPFELWLIRHGETEWSRTGQHTGRTDIPLTDNGREQARQLRPVLAAQSFDAVFSSPLSRAIETCREAGLGGQAILEPDLQEWDYGIYEGRKTPEIREKEPNWSVWNSPMQNGENVEQIQARAQALMKRLLAMREATKAAATDAHASPSAPPTQRIALFSHAHFLRVFAGCWIGDSAALGAHLYLDTATVSILGFDRETRVIRQWNTRHR